MTAVVLAIVAAVLFGVGTAMQAHASSGSRPLVIVHAGSLARAMSRPLWIAGTALDWLGTLTHVAALHFGPLMLVQPLALSAIVFAAPAEAMFSHRRPTVAQMVAAGEAAAGLALVAVFLGGAAHGEMSMAGSTVVVLAVLAVGAPVAVAHRTRGPRTQALLLGTAAGSAYGVSAALVRGAQVAASAHAGSGDWLLEAVGAVVVGGVGLLLSQAALQKSHLSSSMPAQDLVALAVSIGVGAALLGEVPRLTPTVLVETLVAIALVAHGIAQLGRGSRPGAPVPGAGRHTSATRPSTVGTVVE